MLLREKNNALNKKQSELENTVINKKYYAQAINPHTAHYDLLTITAHWVIFTQANLKTMYLELYLSPRGQFYTLQS